MTSFSNLIRQGCPIGTMLTTASTEIADLIADCGFDWLFLDTEHGALTIDGVQPILSVVQGRVPAIVRVPDHQEVWIKKVLDAGADGIIVPQVNNATIAAAVVAAAKYPPLGARSVGVGRAQKYSYGFSNYIANANTETSVVIQIEHIDAVNNIDAILAVPGIDAVFIGPYDLSASLGCIGDINNTLVQQAIMQTRGSCAQVGMPVGIFGLNAAAGRQHMLDKYDFIATGIDLAMLDGAARQLFEDVNP